MNITSNDITFAMKREKRSSPMQILVLMAICLGSFMLPLGPYFFICFASLFGIYWLLWKNYRPGVLVFLFTKQWLQIIAYVIWMVNGDRPIDYLSPHAGIAITLACLGLIIIAATIAQGIRKLPVPTLAYILEEAMRLNEKKVFMLYAISTLFLGSLGYALAGVGGLSQIILTLGSFKWIFFFVYGYISLAKKKRLLLIVIILFEFVTGIFSYFSSFKEVFFFTIILSLTFIRKVSFKQAIYGVVIVSGLSFFFLTWTAVKGEYRSYLNQGTRQQVIVVSRSDAFNKLGDQLSALKWEDYQFSINALLYRVQYILHLTYTMDRVPEVLPHEYGRIWWENVSFVLVPRLIWPDKPIYEATVKTNKYTGKSYAGFKQGSSFSLGYFADSYIDFGYVGMFFPLVLVGLFVVLIYRTLYRRKNINILFRYAAINLVLYEYTAFETDGLMLFGRLLLMFLVFYALCKFVFPSLQRWLYK